MAVRRGPWPVLQASQKRRPPYLPTGEGQDTTAITHADSSVPTAAPDVGRSPRGDSPLRSSLGGKGPDNGSRSGTELCVSIDGICWL